MEAIDSLPPACDAEREKEKEERDLHYCLRAGSEPRMITWQTLQLRVSLQPMRRMSEVDIKMPRHFCLTLWGVNP